MVVVRQDVQINLKFTCYMCDIKHHDSTHVYELKQNIRAIFNFISTSIIIFQQNKKLHRKK